VLQPIDTPALVVDRQQRRNRRHLTQRARQIVDLIETFDIALDENETTRVNRIEESASFRIRTPSLKADDKKLAYLLFKGEMRIPHWSVSGPPGLLFRFLFKVGEKPQRVERGDGIHVDFAQSIPQLFFEGRKKR
jgi:hypothetical protein